MRKNVILIWGMMIGIFAYSQSVQTWTETFDAGLPAGFSTHPPSSGGGVWVSDPLHAPDPTGVNSQSYLGNVPINPGEVTYFQTSFYNFANYDYVTLQFSHICKIAPSDTARIEYQISGTSNWEPLPSAAYLGASSNYTANESFNAASYSEWEKDSISKQPTSSWWKEEAFDIGPDVKYQSVCFRFIITHGTATGTQISKGWLIDNLQIKAATFQIKPPVVQFVSPLVQGNVTSVGPWEINAEVKTTTNARIQTPWLLYTATNGATSTTDSVLMTMVRGDSLWKASIPQFLLGTTIDYSITGKDTTGNTFTATSQYVITQPSGGTPNSAAMFSIDLADTVLSGAPVPVVVTIKNKGSLNLTSATIGYSVNGIPQLPAYNWSGSLPWDFNQQVTIGSYSPAMKKYDTIKAWINLPNGVNDNTTTDDTSTKRVYGSNDYIMGFATIFQDTVYDTGPFPLSASIRKVSGTPFTNVNVSVVATYNGTPTITTVPMTYDVSDNLWKTNIPKTQYESNVVYSISLTDIYNYTETITDSFYIKRPYGGSGAGAAGDTLLGPFTILGAGTYSSVSAAPYRTTATGWSKVLYLGTELGTYTSGGNINKIGYYSYVTTSYTNTDMACYFKAVDDMSVTDDNPDSTGATLVMGGTVITTPRTTTPPPITSETVITLDNSFYLPPGKNLMVYWNNKTAAPTGGGIISDPSWFATTTTNTMTTRTYTGQSQYIVKRTTSRPVTHFYFQTGSGGNYNDTSVALEAIESPLAGVTTGVAIPVRARILNKGIKHLKSCTVSWSKNGTFQSSVTYTGPSPNGLPEEFTDTVTVGYYTSSGAIDTIDVWVSMPNGIVDPQLNDDTLRVITQACVLSLAGTMPIQSGTNSISSVITTIRTCGLTGNLTLQLKGTFTEEVDLTNLTNSLNGYTLTITSLNNHPDSAIIQPASGATAGITLGNTKNVILKAITVNTENIAAHGIHFTNSCSNIVIRNCKLLLNQTSGSTSNIYSVYKPAAGNIDSIFIIDNTLRGGHTGFYFNGGTTTSYSTRVVFDSNKISANYTCGIKALNTNFLHISYNTITGRTSNAASRWDAISLENTNGDIVGNRISQKTNGITLYGLYLSNHSSAQTTQNALIANNEIMFQGNQAVTGLYVTGVKVDFVHNSLDLASTSTSTSATVDGLSIDNVALNNMSIRNNNIVTTATVGHLFKFNGATTYQNQYDIDYNNFYANGNILGFAGNVNHSSIQHLAVLFSPMLNMVSQQPVYMNYTSTELAPNNSLLICPRLTNVTTDINGKSRQTTTSMGAYQMTQNALDLAIMQFVSWNQEVVLNQTVPVTVEVQNFGTNSIQNVVFGWTYNGTRQQDMPWNPTTPLASLGKSSINIGSFNVTSAISTYNVEVWIISVNTTTDAEQNNDTLRASATKSVLVAWEAPFVTDTVYSLSFDVYAKINSATGAPLTTPQLMTTSITQGISYNDSFPMIQQGNGIWKATVLNSYFETKVLYSLTVSDNINNTLTIVNSTYLKDLQKTHDTIIIGTVVPSQMANSQSEAPTKKPYSWTRQIYLYRELSPNLFPGGITIESIAWYNTVASISTYADYNNQTCYMLAVSDSVEANVYQTPASKGATLVWQGNLTTLTTTTGWQEVQLQTPFFLPANMHLEILWECAHGGISIGAIGNWQYTLTSYPSTYYNYNTTSAPATAATCDTTRKRPNLRAVIKFSGNYSPVPNLAIQNILKPVNNPNELCAPGSSPLQIVVRNLSITEYDYTITPATFSVEVLNPVGTTDAAFITKNTGTIAPGKLDTIEIMAALPVMYSGIYHIKTWLTSLLDNIHDDDTLLYDFISSRISLPIDEDFSAGIPPLQFVTDTISSSVQSTAVWEPYIDPTSQISPPPGCNGMLKYEGVKGSMALLSTRQLGLYGLNNPEMSFWYYHDTSAGANDGTYIQVKVIADGITTIEMTLTKYHASVHGWKDYQVNLSKYINDQCVLVRIETMNGGGTSQSVQYLGHIIITSVADLRVSPILISPEPGLCDLQNKNVSVVLTSTTNQAIDLSTSSGNNLIVEVGSNTTSHSVQGRIVGGNESDTVLLLTNADLTGVNRIRVYLASSVDSNPLNDTTSRSVDIRPGISVILDPMTGTNYCFSEGMDVQQTVRINNTGNVPLSNIDLTLQVDTGDVNISSYATLTETYTGTILAQSSYEYTFTKTYKILRSNEYYYLRVKAQLSCDVNVKGEAISEECADVSNILIANLINPPVGDADIVGSTVNIEVAIRNESLKSYSNVGITAQIEDENGQELNTPLRGTVATIAASSTPQSFAFSTPYTVPNVPTYVIKVFLDKVDIYSEDDTLTDSRTTTYVGINKTERNRLTLSQNIPNPAKNSTRIDYSVPEAGEVVFHVYSISGQLLYVKTIEVKRGVHSLELNTDTFAAGFYFYSMEYKGQRLVKRMSIK